MSLSFLQVALICAVYLGILFAIAIATERNIIPKRIVNHPVTSILSLGIFASAWSFYGVIDLANQFGFGALAYYLGTGALFLFSSVLLKPLVELARRYQINSMADLLVFRYHSHWVGSIITGVMLLAMAPLLALQIQAVADTVHLLTRDVGEPSSGQLSSRQTLAFIYSLLIALFAMAFGSNREHHRGLVTAMAFESLIKLFALLAIGFFAIYGVFDGFDGLDQWLQENPENLHHLNDALRESSPHALILVFVATAVSMPHIFHMTVVEHPLRHVTKILPWAFPLFLLLMALPIFPILWSGKALSLSAAPEYFPLAAPLAMNNSSLTIIAFVGGLSAATGAMVAIALALSTMILNHWILPSFHFRAKRDIYHQLTWMRRILIVSVLLAGYGFYVILNNRFSLTELALVAFIATLQLLPGVIAVAHWPSGNRKGLVAGLFVGEIIWLCGLILPMLLDIHEISLFGHTFTLGIHQWRDVTVWSLGLNTLSFIGISHFTRQSDDERYSAELCSDDELSHPVRLTLDIRSPDEIIERLSSRIGRATAEQEVQRALLRLSIPHNESRPYALRRLRDEIEANLSSLMGISMASDIMDRLVPFKVPESHGAADINLIESRLGQVRDHLTGLAGELNNLRLYHRRILEELPLATCSIGEDLEVLMWNAAMKQLTGIDSDAVVGSNVEDVVEPWGKLLTRFAHSNETRFYKRLITLNDTPHWITLHKAAIPSSIANQADGQVIILEDVTELQLLEQELMHSERLASVGRLSAGVAHEIGNPVTGIACLVQNLKYETDNPEILETGEQILSLTKRVNRIVQSLVSFSHAGKQNQEEFGSVRVWECVQEAINLLSLQRDRKFVNFENNVSEDLSIRADSQRLIQVFVNLLSNSRDASPADSTVRVEARSGPHDVVVSVIDEGPGIPKDMIGRIFEPFFTTKDPGEGTGLGLAMVYSIVEDHKGTINIESPANEELQNGTRFDIALPVMLASTDSKSNTIDTQ